MNRTFITACLLTAAWVTVPTGCSVFNGDDDDDHNRVPVTDTSMYGGVPSDAMRVASGFGTLRYRATSPSRVYIGDDTRRVVLTQMDVQSGEEVVVYSDGDAVTVGGRTVYNQNILKNNQHSIFVTTR
ncbi:MAG: hypothetical protein AB7G11_01295 [Phycisphaerales bacterium]